MVVDLHSNWLWHADATMWERDPLYRPGVAAALRRTFTTLVALPLRQPEDYLWACSIVAPYLGSRMAAPQQVRMHFLFARTHEAEREYGLAVDQVDEALTVAAHAHLGREMVELLGFRGKLLRAQERFSEAAEDVMAGLQLLSEQAQREVAIAPTLRLDLLSQLATYEFYLARYGRAARRVKEAHSLLLQAPSHSLEAANMLWVKAHLERARRLPERALRPALTVAEIYLHKASPTSQNRIQTFLAELALDLADSMPGGPSTPEGQQHLRVARMRLTQAEDLARDAHDEPGIGLMRLARARESRLRHRNMDRGALIGQVARTARRLNDAGLLGQALIALGDEMADGGETERGLTCYREAIDVLEAGGISGLTAPARRAILRAGEWASPAQP